LKGVILGSTIAEKILARASGQVRVNAGDNIQAKPDFVVAYDFPGYTDVIFKQMKDEFGLTGVKDPSRYALFIDHMVPAVTPQEEELHQNTRDWGALNHVPVYERKGIGHQVASELGYATPGAFVVHFDGHISQLGTFGTLVLGPASCRFQVLEFGGEAIADMGIDARQTLTCLAMFTGAVTAIINPDQVTLPYAQERARLTIEPLYSDRDATYAARHTIDISQLEPVVVIPPSPANTRNLVDHLGLPVQVGYLGSCASGRLEDLRAAAHVLRGRHVKPGFQLHVVPTSQEIMRQAAQEGLLTDLIAAGAFISSPSCDYCFGRLGVMSAGQRAVSTGTLNVRGRMGSTDSEIFIVNAAAVAAAAIEGQIADPRPYLR